ncbi:spindle pole body component 110-like [Nicotiana sylvestris]|uniref:spindle pole body component 110-like n=1 Tax=Nicotiana sylvestris TaxID=4096 RepID=UPI00388C5202
MARDSQLEAINWKEQFESAQIDIEDLQESKNTLEQRVRALTLELAVSKASSNQVEKEKERLKSSFSEQLSKASEEIRELKALLDQKEVYAGELVQNLTQVQEDLRISDDKLKNDIAAWEKDYEILEEKSAVEESWAFMNSRRDTLLEAGEENFNLELELAKINETIKKAQQTQDFPSPVDEVPVAEATVNVEADTGIPTLSSPIEHVDASQVETAHVDAPAQIESAAIDVPASVPQTSQ